MEHDQVQETDVDSFWFEACQDPKSGRTKVPRSEWMVGMCEGFGTETLHPNLGLQNFLRFQTSQATPLSRFVTKQEPRWTSENWRQPRTPVATRLRSESTVALTVIAENTATDHTGSQKLPRKMRACQGRAVKDLATKHVGAQEASWL